MPDKTQSAPAIEKITGFVFHPNLRFILGTISYGSCVGLRIPQRAKIE
jgi:hypothetical protein